ncbi:Cas10/Cmr2 second palm domain-containing protein [Vibrio alfacsensis]|uniref:Cas10/Cmr2 second palm domain-containing protein n=1 Tax=Vibrio alfacsensis TaxID=1074311 RepID=UPI0040685B91
MTHKHIGYLSITGVNLDSVLFDTDKLSVTRGASFILKKAIELIEHKYQEQEGNKHYLSPLSTGASEGLFEVKSLDTQSALNDLATEVQSFLNRGNKSRENDLPTQYFSFIVAVTEETDYSLAKEQLITKTRMLQMQSFSLSPEMIPSEGKYKFTQTCQWSGIYPAQDSGSELGNLGESVKARRLIGKKQKRELFKNEFSLLPPNQYYDTIPDTNELKVADLPISDDLESLAKIAKTELKGKIALFYADGNKFGKIQQHLLQECTTSESTKRAQRHFDDEVKKYRATFLQRLVEVIHTHYQDVEDTANDFPLEVLMWGGDEFYFIVPAELGFKAVQTFYDISKDWQIANPDTQTSPYKLTHAGGLVFCPAKTPLKVIQSLAHDLAEEVKSTIGPELEHQTNAFNVMALESIDYPTESLSEFWQHHYGERLGKIRLPLEPFRENWFQLIANLKTLSKGQLYRLVHSAIEEWRHGTKSQHSFKEQLARLDETTTKDTNELENDLRSLFTLVQKDHEKSEENSSDFSFDILPWIYLIELWDYLPQEGEK